MKRWSLARRRSASVALAALASAALVACAGDGHGIVDPLSGEPALFAWTLPAGWLPPHVPPDNPMSAAKVELGRRLFYDTRLSGNGAFSCASCHRQEFAFADARNIPLGSTGETHPRNSMGLANAGYQRTFNWASPGTTTLERQSLVPLFGSQPVELGLGGQEAVMLDRLRAEPVYQRLFRTSFPAVLDPVNVLNVTKALAAFQRTLVSGDAPFDRAARGTASAMSAAARRGEALFRSPRLRCAECHGGTLFTAGAEVSTPVPGQLSPPPPPPRPPAVPPFFNTGLYNLGGAGGYPARNRGLFEVTGRPEDMGRFRVPSLRNLAFTFPYMHDGSISSLGDVVDHYARGGRLVGAGANAGDGALNPLKDPRITGFSITAQERADVVAFLQALSDSSFVANPRFANPWNPR